MTSLLTRGRRLRTRAVVNSGLPAALDRVLVARAVRAARRAPDDAHRPPHHMIIAAPGAGNVGDQAMLESILENTTGPTVVVVGTAVQQPTDHESRVSWLVLPDLLYGKGAPHRDAVRAFGRTLAGASHLSLIGADVMDGTYSLPASVRRSALAAAAARAGVNTRVLGFSWPSSPRPTARRELARASRRGVRLMLRDPVSAERARRRRVPSLVDVADIVFTARTVDASLADRLLADVHEPVALLNVSGLLAERVDLDTDYVDIVRELRAHGLHVVVLPHVSRPRGDDVPACEAVYARVAGPGIDILRELPTPAQVRGLTARATVTVTGRMHLAIMSLMNGVPAVTLATQGKVEGLMHLFGAVELCVDPLPGLSAKVSVLLDQIMADGSPLRANVQEKLPVVTALAQVNLVGLPGHRDLVPVSA